LPIGVLALQGDVREHIHLLAELGSDAVEVRTADQLSTCDALVIPGGESTTISKLLVNFGLMDPVQNFVSSKPVLGTCAGLILLSEEVVGRLPGQHLIGGLPTAVERNAYGGQTHSFEAEVDFTGVSETVAFIRAPRIIDFQDCEVIARLGNDPVAIRYENVFGATFHPELTGAKELHKQFLIAVEGA